MDRILILDFGSQVTQLIARRVRETGVYCDILPFNASDSALQEYSPRGVILSGGPASTLDKGSPRVPEIVWKMSVPVLSICYGQQSMCLQLGGKVEGGHSREFGKAFLEIKTSSDLYSDFWPVGSRQQVWMSHGDRVTKLPDGFTVTAVSEGAPFAFIEDRKRRYYGTMFHPEVVHTLDGIKLLKNFVIKICGCKSEWSMKAFLSTEIKRIQEKVKNGKVICGLSGGVDSSVAAVLIHEAIGSQLTCIYVDTGLMREGETEQVVSLFRTHYNIPLVAVDARKIFLEALEGVSDPEKKRKTIGKLFIDIFDEEARKIKDVEYLAQGTLYPDVIESLSFTGGPSVTIKSHHNVGGLPDRMKLKLLEPLRELFKDEVRSLGRELGLPETFIGRHPFPGPGLAIRVLSDVTSEKLNVLRQADTIYLDEIRKAGLYHQIWQAFAVLLPVRTVGVMGDGRSYDNVLALRAVTSVDGMTAESYPFEHSFLARVATRIINEVRGINRVVYDVTSKPPGTIEWE